MCQSAGIAVFRDPECERQQTNISLVQYIAMGKSPSLTVVAQGVETREQAEHLGAHACDQLQGFYFNRPLPPEQFACLLRDQDTEVTYVGRRRGTLAS